MILPTLVWWNFSWANITLFDKIYVLWILFSLQNLLQEEESWAFYCFSIFFGFGIDDNGTKSKDFLFTNFFLEFKEIIVELRLPKIFKLPRDCFYFWSHKQFDKISKFIFENYCVPKLYPLSYKIIILEFLWSDWFTQRVILL